MEYNKSDYIQALREVDARCEGKLSTRKYNELRDDCHPHGRTVRNAFGTWDEAKEAAGIDTYGVTRRDCIEAITEVNEQVDDILSRPLYEELKSDDHPGTTVFEEIFGGWNKAKEAAGLEKYGATRQDCMDALVETSERVDGVLTRQLYNEYKDSNHPAANTIWRVLDGWNEAKEAAGLETIEYDYSKEECIKALRIAGNRCDTVLTTARYNQFRASDSPCASTISKKFGSFDEAKKQAGLELTYSEHRLQMPYGRHWNTVRREILDRDGHACVKCDMMQGEHKEEYNVGLHVHHMKKIREFLYGFTEEELEILIEGEPDDELRERAEEQIAKANKPWNLVTLCVECHTELEDRPVSEQLDILGTEFSSTDATTVDPQLTTVAN